jgi:hypothetical protein
MANPELFQTMKIAVMLDDLILTQSRQEGRYFNFSLLKRRRLIISSWKDYQTFDSPGHVHRLLFPARLICEVCELSVFAPASSHY